MSVGKQPLGKGLAALISDTNEYHEQAVGKRGEENTVSKSQIREIDLADIAADDSQPRQDFDENKLDELAASIKEHGILQPILVKEVFDNDFQIIAGERRWRAAVKAGLNTIPAIVKNLDDDISREVAIVENVQRQDLSPIEEALAYSKLTDEYGYTQESLAKKMGKSRSYIANTIRLKTLPNEVQSLIKDRKITAGHARALISHPEPEKLAKKIIRFNLNVRQTESLAKTGDLEASTPPPRKKIKQDKKVEQVANIDEDRVVDDDIVYLEKILSQGLNGLKVSILDTADGGVVNIKFEDLEQLDNIVQVITSDNTDKGVLD